MSDSDRRARPSLFPRIMAIVIALVGLWLAGAGAYLLSLGGSLYYAIAGIGLLATALLLWRGKAAALLVFAASCGSYDPDAEAEAQRDWEAERAAKRSAAK